MVIAALCTHDAMPAIFTFFFLQINFKASGSQSGTN